ncbi:MAG: glutamate--tRNA ligase family protein [Minisyncoccia bacterium]
MNGKVVTRFAPSPTGYLHAGSYRTALYSSIFARQNGGKFILRIEDTDRERSKKEYEDDIIDSLRWLGLKYDGLFRQSERQGIYKKHLESLLASGLAYVSKETPKEPGDREEVIRFKNPNRRVAFEDLIRGRIEFDTAELGDFVVAKSMDEPTFHLANVIDDYEMGVSHVIRGEDHISNTPRHILIYEALKAPVPRFAHIPLLLAADRSKLSKRNGAVPVSEYRARGFLPEAVVNYLSLLGWHPEDDREILSWGEIVKEFSLERVQKAGAVFDEDKLRWFNRQYSMKLSDADFVAHAAAFLPKWLQVKSPVFKRLLPLVRNKVSTFGDIAGLFGPEGELGFVRALPDYPAELILWKKEPDRKAALGHLKECRDLMGRSPDGGWTAEALKQAVWPYAEKEGRGNVLWPLRVALTGQERSPDPFASAALLGREESLRRIDAAIKGCA